MSHLEEQSTLHLLTGLPCSGKTTFARDLESRGVVRVSVDEMMIGANGRLGVDHDVSEHLALLSPIVDSALSIVEAHLSRGAPVVLDHGLGRRVERDRLKRLAEANGAVWELYCFDVDMSTLRNRCRRRTSQPDTVPISDEMLDFLATTWERPDGEGEQIVRMGDV